MDAYPSPSARRKRSYDESMSGGTTHSSFSMASRRTRRRKTIRRMRSNVGHYEEEELLKTKFEHIKLINRQKAYNKLNTELVVADADPLVLEFIDQHPPPIDDFNREDWTFVKACTPVEMAHLMHFDRAESVPPPKYTPSIRRAANIVADKLALPTLLFFPEKHRLKDVKFYPNKFAGIEYATMGLKTRAEAEEQAQADAEQAFTRLMDGLPVEPHDVRLGGRGKVARMTREGAESKPPAVGRLILMMSHRDLKLCGVTENQLTGAYSSDDFPISVGMSWYHGGTAKFIQRMLPHKRFFCFDAAKFDSSIDPWMVRIAINILREQYVDGHNEQYNAYWEFVFQSLVRAPIYRDDGLRFQKEVGTTSGHSHNTLIQSIITLIVGYGALVEMNPALSDEDIVRLAHMESLGDDNIMGLSGVLSRHTTEEIAGVVKSMFMVNWFGKKSFSTSRLLDPIEGEFQGVQYLGKYFRLAEYPLGDAVREIPLPYRPAQETFLRLLYPEYGAHTLTDTWLRVLGNYIDAAGNNAMENWLQDFLDFLEPRMDSTPKEWPPNFKRMVSRDYSNVGVMVPKPERLSFEQWRDLVVLSRTEYVKRWKDE
ncbi:putative RNA-dependent RNA polymerase [Beauveria bassiana bipartite mycovirus 1]|nr:putative RNA-dependent RNA polymerase [Beauveria bassiana bipartite mycovirus 1]